MAVRLLVLISEVRKNDIKLYSEVAEASMKLWLLGFDVFSALLNAPTSAFAENFRRQMHEMTLRMLTSAEAAYAVRNENPSKEFEKELRLASALKLICFFSMEQAETWVRNHQ